MLQKNYNLVAPKSEKRKKFLCKKREEREPKLYILFILPNRKFEASNKLGNYTCKTFPSEVKVAPNWCLIHHHLGCFSYIAGTLCILSRTICLLFTLPLKASNVPCSFSIILSFFLRPQHLILLGIKFSAMNGNRVWNTQWPLELFYLYIFLD